MESENKSNIINGCKDIGGNWLDNYYECESASIPDTFENYCRSFGGIYEGCNSPCRNDPVEPVGICTAQCIATCEFG